MDHHYKTLGQAYANTTPFSTDLYTCGAAGGAVASTLTIDNQTSSQIKVTVSKRVGGAAADPKQELMSAIPIDPGMTPLTVGWCFANGDVLTVKTDIPGVSFNLDGDEVY